MPHAPFRLLRTTAVATTILGLAAGAHLLGGGTLPAPAIMVAIMALHILCSTIATRFQISPATMVALLASSQLVLHQSFEMLSHGVRAGVAPGAPAMSHHGMSAEEHASAMMASSVPLASSGIENLSHTVQMSPWMWAAHIAATLAAAVLLAYGEDALWALAGWLRPLYRSAAVVLEIPAKSSRPAIMPRPLPRLPWRNLRANTRRGPPAGVAIFA
ncbi:hypothetical protein [Arthrobacter psychrochitiniphilus]|uniref:Uncharacterized protein n=1 Tax=Arthrobacter psychrochitiniphilus TaxID=291045 RepID=A0A2V3DTG9_9MICC|nr:hypothetical protein [Arthrobacter psychrochitiniphilus]NYG15828.1 hypothetical protein [Arthrobacter psychrochitiniphilus]PXA66725.1 hypothetical protein CVS29_03895 [Arthrobacter psychrochitiniphilus]